MFFKKALIFPLLIISFTCSADSSHAYANAVLEALQQKGLLSQHDVENIKQQALSAESKQIKQQASQPKSTILTATANRISGTSNNAIKTKSDINFWGLIQPRYSFVPSKNGIEGTNSITVRRARFGFQGNLTDQVRYRFQYDASSTAGNLPSTQRLLDAWVSFKHFDDTLGSLTVGQQFIPGYTRRPHKSASVERKFSEFLSPGAVGRVRGISLRKGNLGLPETSSTGYFDNRLHYAVGLFNTPDLSVNNDNNDLLFSAAFSVRPTGLSHSDDEYQFIDRPFTYALGASYSMSKDSATLDTKFQADTTHLDNEWLTVFADVQGHHWWGWASWAQFESDAKGGLATNTQGDATDTLSSTAFTLGLSRAYTLNTEQMGWAWALQYQHVDNEHPSRSFFFRPSTGRGADDQLGMNQGSVYQSILTWQFSKDIRLINELSYYKPTDGNFSYPAFISQLQVAF